MEEEILSLRVGAHQLKINGPSVSDRAAAEECAVKRIRRFQRADAPPSTGMTAPVM